jgi:AcrR family transcriptional regulator
LLYRLDGIIETMKVRGSSSTRENILRAANLVVVEEGVSRMTLEAVAREAGVSKVLHLALK